MSITHTILSIQGLRFFKQIISAYFHQDVELICKSQYFVYSKVKMLRKQNRLQEGQTCFSILPEQPFPGVLSSHPVQALCQWMSTSLVGNDTNILSSLPSGAQFHFNVSAGLITQGHRNIIFSPSLTVHEHVLLFPSKANTKTMDTHTHTHTIEFCQKFFFFSDCAYI